MKFTISTFIALMLLLTSCDNSQKVQKTEFDTLFAEVMKIHDDVMPETNNLYKLKKIAQENIAVLPDTSSMIKELMDIQLFSDKADDAMMVPVPFLDESVSLSLDTSCLKWMVALVRLLANVWECMLAENCVVIHVYLGDGVRLVGALDLRDGV